jgi:hypothetical protein
MKKHILLATTICVLFTVLCFGVIKRTPNRSMLDTINSGSLREKAARAGHVTATARPSNLHRYDDVTTLARDSAAVVIGTVNSEDSSLLTPEEKIIVTDYQINVQDVFKGNLQPGATIIVREPGGAVQFDDGTSAEVRLPDYWRNPSEGKTYIFFLKSRADKYWVLLGGSQGLFEITSSGSIEPQARYGNRMRVSYEGMAKDSFLQEIQKSVGQKQ